MVITIACATILWHRVAQHNGSSRNAAKKKKLQQKNTHGERKHLEFSNRHHNGLPVTLSFRGVTVHTNSLSPSRQDEVRRSRWNQRRTAFSTAVQSPRNRLSRQRDPHRQNHQWNFRFHVAFSGLSIRIRRVGGTVI